MASSSTSMGAKGAPSLYSITLPMSISMIARTALCFVRPARVLCL